MKCGRCLERMEQFRRQLVSTRGGDAVSNLQAFTKWIPIPTRMTRRLVEQNIDRSLERMGVETLDPIQFHWWEYRDKNYLDALAHMAKLQKERKIKHLALTNFDTKQLKIITQSGIKIVSNQIQFSLIDRRLLVKMVSFSQEHDVKLLAYETRCGGLLSKKYLGQPEPRSGLLNTAFLRKYKNMVDAWGGWSLFQELLSRLKQIADKYTVSIANVAVRYILEQLTVAGAIVGARLGVAEHLADNAKVFSFTLDRDDRTQIEAVVGRSPDLYQEIGNCGDEYRH